MSAPSVNSTPASVGLPGAEAGVRPQLQSRRVSLRLGPLGVTYATDQVLWTDAAASAAAGAAASQRTEQEAASQAEARQEAERTGRGFSQELLEALRRQTQERAPSAAYGPDGLPRDETGARGAVQPGDGTDEARREADGAGGKAGSRADSQTGARAGSPPTARVRQAIAAYLSCAGQFRQARPMLSAVA